MNLNFNRKILSSDLNRSFAGFQKTSNWHFFIVISFCLFCHTLTFAQTEFVFLQKGIKSIKLEKIDEAVTFDSVKTLSIQEFDETGRIIRYYNKPPYSKAFDLNYKYFEYGKVLVSGYDYRLEVCKSEYKIERSDSIVRVIDYWGKGRCRMILAYGYDPQIKCDSTVFPGIKRLLKVDPAIAKIWEYQLSKIDSAKIEVELEYYCEELRGSAKLIEIISHKNLDSGMEQVHYYDIRKHCNGGLLTKRKLLDEGGREYRGEEIMYFYDDNGNWSYGISDLSSKQYLRRTIEYY